MPLLLTLMLLATASVVVFTVADSLGGGKRQLVKRARAFGGSAPARAQLQAERALKRQRGGRIDALVQRVLPRPAVLRTRLAATGYAFTFAHYGAACVVAMAASFALAMAVHAPLILSLLEAAATGLWLPHMMVGILMSRRRKRFFKLFPDAIGLLVRGLRAGLPIAETIGAVGREIADPVGEEFRGVAQQVRLGQSLEEALWQTGRRIDLPEFNFLVISLSVQRETGGNLAETLENLEQILRKRQQMRLKIRAMSSEATASALIIGALPFVTAGGMFLVSRAYLTTLFTTDLGRVMMGGAAVSLSIGFFVIWRMVRFEI